MAINRAWYQGCLCKIWQWQLNRPQRRRNVLWGRSERHERFHRTLIGTACIRTETPAVSRRTRKKDAIMQTKLAIVLALLALAGTAPLLTACYTTQGAGEDLQAAGHGLEHSAERHTGY
jgi:predicted small secreted protein